MTMGGLGTAKNPSHGIKSGIVSMMVIFNHGYSMGWAPVSHTLSPEIPSMDVRDMTYRCASVFNIATQYVGVPPLGHTQNADYATDSQ
jgi:MFS transporter, SP family, sugar:H+ symporter